MATRLLNLGMDGLTAAKFRAWVQEIHDALAAFGWIQTTDAAQINIATIGAPGAVSQSMGYEIWRMADGLQATAPVFMKIEYGSSNVSVGSASVWVTLGTGSDGAGNLTGRVGSRCAAGMSSDGNAHNLYTSGANNRFCLGYHHPTLGNNSLYFGVERTKDANGADTNEGVLYSSAHFDSGAGRQSTIQVLLFAVTSSQPAVSMGNSVSDQGYPCGPMMHKPLGQANDGTNIGAHPWSFPGRLGSEQPGLNCLSYWRQDFAAGSQVTINLYGADHGYRTLGGDASTMGIFNTGVPYDINSMLMMRYE